MVTLMTKYGKQGKWDDAIRVAQEWLKSHPEDDSGVSSGFVSKTNLFASDGKMAITEV